MRAERAGSVRAADPELQARLDHLATLDLTGLRQRWRRTFGRAAPSGLPKALLHRALAYRMQAEALGDLDRATLRALDRMAEEGREVIALPDRRGTKPGTLLVREWQCAMHSVMVLEEGYAWMGQTFSSLSEVAHAITGTKWNGPRFFGLRDRQGSQDPGRAR